MKTVVLIENTAPEGSCLASEHGLSFYVEHRGKAILLDCLLYTSDAADD